MEMSNSFLIMRFDNDVYYNYLLLTTFQPSIQALIYNLTCLLRVYLKKGPLTFSYFVTLNYEIFSVFPLLPFIVKLDKELTCHRGSFLHK